MCREFQGRWVLKVYRDFGSVQTPTSRLSYCTSTFLIDAKQHFSPTLSNDSLLHIINTIILLVFLEFLIKIPCRSSVALIQMSLLMYPLFLRFVLACCKPVRQRFVTPREALKLLWSEITIEGLQEETLCDLFCGENSGFRICQYPERLLFPNDRESFK